MLGTTYALQAQSTQKVVRAEDAPVQSILQPITPFSPLLQAPVTKASIAPGKPQWVNGKQGTTALVSTSDFVFEDGSPVTGTVEFELMEVTKKSDLILYNLPTTSDGKLLETGGVVKLEAYSDGRPLKLGPNKQIPISFPDGQRYEMQVFQGVPNSENGMNWKPIGVPRTSPGFTVTGASGKSSYALDSRFTMRDEALLKSFHPMTELGSVNAATLRFEGKSRSLESYILAQLEAYYPCTGIGEFVVHVRFDKQGVPTLIGAEPNENRCITLAIAEILAPLRWKAPENVEEVAITIERKNRQSIPAQESMFVSLVDHPSAPLDKANIAAYNHMMARIEEQEEAYRQRKFISEALQVSSLGWINCDRFAQQRDVVTMTFQTSKTDFILRSFLVFNNLNSVMDGETDENGRLSFPRIPNKMKVKLVTIGYDAHAQCYIQILPLLTANGNGGTIAVNPVTKENLRQALEAL